MGARSPPALTALSGESVHVDGVVLDANSPVGRPLDGEHWIKSLDTASKDAPMTQIRPSTSYISGNLWQHCFDEGEFREEERRRREANDGGATMFFSHCWRDPETQARKRQIIGKLSGPAEEGGCSCLYWGDYLDLQATGPVPWRQYISDGITSCSKFVAFVDEAWLKSFNCLQELAMAISANKPVVVLILDSGAWDLLTIPGRSQEAWEGANAEAQAEEWAQHVWEDEQHGAALCRYQGEDIVPGKPLSLKVVGSLMTHLAGINLCPCRDLELINWGPDTLSSNAAEYVMKDLAYHQQHAELGNLALRWQQRGSPSSLLLSRKEAAAWHEWLSLSKSSGAKPEPTLQQKALVEASTSRATGRRRRARLVGAAVLVLILAGLVASVAMAIQFMEQSREAARQRGAAEENLALAEAAQVQTELEKASVEASMLVARAQAEPDSFLALSLLSRAAELATNTSRPDLEQNLVQVLGKVGSQQVLSTGLNQIGNLTTQVLSLAWLPDMPVTGQRRLAYGTSNGDVHVWHLDTNTTAVLATSGMPVVGLSFVTALQQLAAFRQDGTVRLYDIPASSTATSVTPSATFSICNISASGPLTEDEQLYNIKTSADGATAGFLITTSTACLVDFLDMSSPDRLVSRVVQLPFDLNYGWVLDSFSISPDGTMLAAGAYCQVYIAATSTGQLLHSFGGPDRCFDHFPAASSWSSNSRSLVLWFNGFYQDQSWHYGFMGSYDLDEEQWQRGKTIRLDSSESVTV
eukprot:jgi/Tetstr1/440231/TSEL_028582.t1